MNTVRLKGDKRLRERLFVPDAYQHPAKGHLGLWEAIIERHTSPGEWILDPMAGVGSALIGALMGRSVICLELEEHFLRPMMASAMKVGLVPPRRFLITPEEYFHLLLTEVERNTRPTSRVFCSLASLPVRH